MRCRGEAKRSCDKCGGAKTGIAVQTQCFASLACFTPRTNGPISCGIDWRLSGINGTDAEFLFATRERKIPAQQDARLLEQPVVGGIRQISNAHLRRIAPAT